MPEGISEDVSGCPVSYIAIHVQERSACLVGTSRYLGTRWYEHRGGDYISHVLMIPDAFFPFRFSELLHSNIFWQEVPEELRNRALEYMKRPFEEDPPPLEEISQETFLTILERGRETANEKLKQVACKVHGDEFANLFDNLLERSAETSEQINLASSSICNIMEFIPDFLPPGIRATVNFETFACNNVPKKALFSGYLSDEQSASINKASSEIDVDLPSMYDLAERWGAMKVGGDSIDDYRSAVKFLYMTQNGIPLVMMPLELLTHQDKRSEYLKTVLAEVIESRKNGWEARAVLAKSTYGLEVAPEIVQEAEAAIVENERVAEIINLIVSLQDGIEKQANLLKQLLLAIPDKRELLGQCGKLISERPELARTLLLMQPCVEKPLGDMAASALALNYLGSKIASSPLSAELKMVFNSHTDIPVVKAVLICLDLQEKLSLGQTKGKEISHALGDMVRILGEIKEAVCIWLPSILSHFPLTEMDFCALYALCAKSKTGLQELIKAFLPQNGGMFNYLVMLVFLSRHFEDNAKNSQEFLDVLEQLRKCSYPDWLIVQNIFGDNFHKMLEGVMQQLMDYATPPSENAEEGNDKTSIWKHVKSFFR
ncbi:MAG: hypothetical protein IJS08_09915 [Victivallales bacterium]|nr:hypothetical protein [Victivallales bacterium]